LQSKNEIFYEIKRLKNAAANTPKAGLRQPSTNVKGSGAFYSTETPAADKSSGAPPA
jgi:hypothetical protein